MRKNAPNRSVNMLTASSSGNPSYRSNEQRDPSTHQWRYAGIVKGGLFKGIKSIPFDPKVDVPHGVCFNCWQYGHSRQKCSEPDRLDHCRNCGRIGVKVKDCPRCSEAYLNHWQKERQNPTLESLKLELFKVRKEQGWNKSDNRVYCIHFTDVEPIPFDPELDIPFKICSNCWKTRHPGQCENRRLHDHCFNCGRVGVNMTICPRCSKAYPRYCEKKIQDGIDKALPATDESLSISKQPETTKISSKSSVFKTISPTSAASCLELSSPSKVYAVIKSSKPPAADTTTIEATTMSRKSGSNQRDPSTHPWRYRRIVKGSLHKDIEPIPFDPKVDVPHGVCFNCWEVGHSRQNCSWPKLSDCCHNCGRVGVKVLDCPRCSTAHHLYWKKQRKYECHELQGNVFQVKENQNCNAEFCFASLQSIVNKFTDNVFTEAEDENYDDIIVDENEESYEVTDNFLENFLNLKNGMKFLPIEEQTTIAQKFVTSHCTQILRKEV